MAAGFPRLVIGGVLALGAILLARPTPVSAAPASGDKPADVYLRSGKMEEVVGTVVRFDDETVVLKTARGERSLRWLDMTGPSAFSLRARLADPANAVQQLSLGEMGWAMGMKDQAKTALARAVKIDSSLKPKADAVLGTELGAAVKQAKPDPATAAASTTPKPPRELIHPATGTPAAPSRFAGNPNKPTPEQDAAEIEGARARAAEAQTTLNMKFAEFTTPHFIVFTDWDPREYNFLRTNLEGAYGAVAQVFDLSTQGNIFIGKLPVYMLAKEETFESFSKEVDAFPVQARTAGYYAYRGTVDHMVMWKPDPKKYGGTQQAERAWGRVLTHEFTHAFVHHYHTERAVPRWLNEGLAEAVAANLFPVPQAYDAARQIASQKKTIGFLFTDDEEDKKFEYYPVHRTLTETLIVKDRKGFVTLFDAMKEGTSFDEALKQQYKWDHAAFEQAWRQYLSSQPERR